MTGRTAWLVGALAVSMLLGAIGAAPGMAASPYVVGAVFDSSGPAAPLGTPERNTALMIEAAINRSGGINGHPLKLVVMDNASEETKCVLAVKKLIEEDKVLAIIGPSQTGTTLAVVPLVESAQVPLVSCAAAINIVDPVRKWVFKTPQSDNFAVEKLIDYMKPRKINKIAFINVNNAFGMSGLAQAEKLFPKAGIKIVAKEMFGPTDTDMTVQLAKIRAANPQAVVCWGTNPGPARVAVNMRTLGMKQPLFMSHGIANRKFIELAGQAAEGVIFPAGRLLVYNSIPKSDPRQAVLARYASLYQAAYKQEADTFGGHAWDALYMVVKALQKAGSSRPAIRRELENMKNFPGTAGFFNMSPRDHNGLNKDSFVMVKITKGDWQLIK